MQTLDTAIWTTAALEPEWMLLPLLPSSPGGWMLCVSVSNSRFRAHLVGGAQIRPSGKAAREAGSAS